MSRIKYILIVLFFAAIVAKGISVVFDEFNYMVSPAVPVSTFGQKNCGPGAWQFDFLGEKASLKLPANILDFLEGEAVEKNVNRIKGSFINIKYCGGQALDVLSNRLDYLTGEVAPAVYSRIVETCKRLQLQGNSSGWGRESSSN